MWPDPQPVHSPNLCYLPFIPPGCDPAEEGQPTKITCDVDTTTCQNLFVAKWQLGRREFSTCTKSRCGNFISGDKMDATTTIGQTSSTLTLRDVSRTSAEYNSDTKWICSPCGGPEVTVCNGLEIYGEFITGLFYIVGLSRLSYLVWL